MVDEKILKKFGFINDEDKLKLKEVFEDCVKSKEVYIDIYSENPLNNSSTPVMLLLRVIEKNIVSYHDNGWLALKKNDVFNTSIMSVPFAEITECYYESGESYSGFILKIQNIYYRITVFN